MKQELKNRTKKFTAECWQLCANFPMLREYNAFYNQLVRCLSSVDANYSAACRVKYDKDFTNKLKIVEEEADESMYLLELLAIVSNKEYDDIKKLHAKANELLSITVASIKTMPNRICKSEFVNG